MATSGLFFMRPVYNGDMKTFIVCGGRDFHDQHIIYHVLNRLHAKVGIGLLVHGDARGADRIAGMWAKDHNVPYLAFPADWHS